jgi:GH35 family endo-1,4-beta-xylanase
MISRIGAGNDPYFRGDPGPGLRRITVYSFDIENNFNQWESWRTNDGRIIPDNDSSFSAIENPFATAGSLIRLSTYFDPAAAGKPYGGYGLRAPINPALPINGETFVQFDLYYPSSAAGKYMRFEIWSTSSGGAGSQADAGSLGQNKTQVYIRTADLDDIGNLNPEWTGYYHDETWFKKSFSSAVPVSDGSWEYLNIDLHTEPGAKLDGDLLLLGNISITQTDPDGTPIPDVVNAKHYSEVIPIKKKYNPDNGYFLMGTIGTGTVTPNSIRGYHYELFVGGSNLKPIRHIRAPQWLDPDAVGPEWNLPTGEYLGIRESGKPGEYKMHGHVLAWYNQSPSWMRRIIPENVTSMQWNADGLFYVYGNNAAGPFQKADKNTARRVYFNHILYEMRQFMTTNERYGSSEERGIIPFHSFDVLNEEIHESRHSVLLRDNPDEWKTALKHLSWLMAMTDNDINDIRQHYIYLLFKYAHIAVPNAQMAEKYKAGYHDPDIVPEYMKLDNHDHDGSIDAYITAKPPILVYNDYDIAAYTKARVAYNMVKDLNAAWKTDPLYDGRNLIECMGIQGHDTVSPTLASRNEDSVRMFASLIDEGLLDWICYSELDLKLPDSAPGGGALAPAVLNQKQADVIGYQYALLFRVFDQYKKYIDHVLIWGQAGSGFQNSYVPFDHEQMASQAYYGIMNPDKFIKGHAYLSDYFDAE